MAAGGIRSITTAALLAVAAGCASAPERQAIAPAPSRAQPVVRPVERVLDGSFAFQGAITQGGIAIGQAPPGTTQVLLDGKPVPVHADGRFVIGFGRDAPGTATVEAWLQDGTRVRELLRVAPRTFRIERIPSLVQSSKPNPEFERLRAEERARINAARAQTSDLPYWQERFIWPAVGRISGIYGSQRILGGVPRSPHAGVDVAAPTGTTVVAPAGGRVVLASPPAFSLEGNLLIIDHGYNLFSAFLHLSRIDVKVGDLVKQGQPVGAIGRTGRATGPHLHWALSWGDVRVDPQLLVGPMPAGGITAVR